ncbi:hypothetical protein FYJ27_03315 [Anaerosalibacter bizertensis]|uniref:Uncharacterized protein n=1 Tax=Anaerosalibacter bizertensis TaxID=932217 RepID=A0A844FFN9_9FIRM|nr:adenosylcobinamide amidohydrolase [Anaerosalibacter bizertensis]MSS42762.1 hypothetical protein [Anaerosalibacter bizertensis]
MMKYMDIKKYNNTLIVTDANLSSDTLTGALVTSTEAKFDILVICMIRSMYENK